MGSWAKAEADPWLQDDGGPLGTLRRPGRWWRNSDPMTSSSSGQKLDDGCSQAPHAHQKSDVLLSQSFLIALRYRIPDVSQLLFSHWDLDSLTPRKLQDLTPFESCAPRNSPELDADTFNIMGWFGIGSSGSGGPKKLSDGGFEAPDRTNRSKCYAARDHFFACLDRHEILDSIKEDGVARQKCGPELAEFENACVKTWVRSTSSFPRTAD
jgi:cytochrome c oxidase assembly factor 6